MWYGVGLAVGWSVSMLLVCFWGYETMWNKVVVGGMGGRYRERDFLEVGVVFVGLCEVGGVFCG